MPPAPRPWRDDTARPLVARGEAAAQSLAAVVRANAGHTHAAATEGMAAYWLAELWAGEAAKSVERVRVAAGVLAMLARTGERAFRALDRPTIATARHWPSPVIVKRETGKGAKRPRRKKGEPEGAVQRLYPD